MNWTPKKLSIVIFVTLILVVNLYSQPTERVGTTDKWIISTKELRNKGEYDKAIQNASDCIKVNPYYSECYVIRAEILYYAPLKIVPIEKELENIDTFAERDKEFKRRFDLAINDLRKAEEINPNNKDIYIVRSSILESHNKTNEAIADLSKAIDLVTLDSDLYAKRAGLYLKQGESEKALKDLQGSIFAKPNANAFFQRADIYLKKNEYKKAVDDLTTALQITNSLVMREEIYRIRSEIYAREKCNYEYAIEDLTLWMELNSSTGGIFGINNDYKNALLKRAELYRKLGKEDLAKEDEEKANNLKPKRALPKRMTIKRN